MRFRLPAFLPRVLGLGLLAGATLACQLQQPAPPPGESTEPADQEPVELDLSQGEVLEMVLATQCDTEEFRLVADSVVIWVKGYEAAHAIPGEEVEQEPEDEVRIAEDQQVFVSAEELNNSQRHDCQALAEGKQLGPVVALFTSLERVESGPFDQGRVVADLVRYGAGDYEPLDIRAQLSCLWIRSPTPPETEWTAAIRVPPSGACASAVFDTAPRATLEVRRFQVAGLPPADYPATGRWMWDPAREEQFIGIRCGDGWCEIGRSGFTPTASITSRAEIPGWYDAQFLAVPSPTGSGLVRSDLWGRIAPGPANRVVERQSPAAPETGPWHVASMTFDGNDQDAWDIYVQKLALKAQSPNATHIVHLRKQQTPGGPAYELKGPEGLWTSVRRCNTAHSGSGTVRWAWSEQDEGLWVPCDAGCCMATRLLRSP